jgi:hypothetical protein
MTREQAKACVAFLQRVQLSGAEVEAFLSVHRALLEIINPPERGPAEVEGMSRNVTDNL